jgi:hypothetical protein
MSFIDPQELREFTNLNSSTEGHDLRCFSSTEAFYIVFIGSRQSCCSFIRTVNMNIIPNDDSCLFFKDPKAALMGRLSDQYRIEVPDKIVVIV